MEITNKRTLLPLLFDWKNVKKQWQNSLVIWTMGAVAVFPVMSNAVPGTLQDFSKVSHLVLSGTAKTVATAEGVVLRLTPTARDQSGSAFSRVKVNTAQFSTFFKFQMTELSDGGAADGLVFVIQSVGSSAGGPGNGMGYQGIPNSVGIEFDTWNNGTWANDSDNNHIAINTNGQFDGIAVSTKPLFQEGDIWHVWIDYDGKQMEVRANITGQRPAEPLVTRQLDITQILGGSSKAFVGFTAGTGYYFANHDIRSWTYLEKYAPIEQSTVQKEETGTNEPQPTETDNHTDKKEETGSDDTQLTETDDQIDENEETKNQVTDKAKATEGDDTQPTENDENQPTETDSHTDKEDKTGSDETQLTETDDQIDKNEESKAQVTDKDKDTEVDDSQPTENEETQLQPTETDDKTGSNEENQLQPTETDDKTGSDETQLTETDDQIDNNQETGSQDAQPIENDKNSTKSEEAEEADETQLTDTDKTEDGETQSNEESRYTDNGNGTVTDNVTGLIWLKNANCIGTEYPDFDKDSKMCDGKVTWQHAQDFIGALNAGQFPKCSGDYNDWRLPTVQELISLINYDLHNPAMSPGIFSNVISDSYWTATLDASNHNFAWRVKMNYGLVFTENKSDSFYVLPVKNELDNSFTSSVKNFFNQVWGTIIGLWE